MLCTYGWKNLKVINFLLKNETCKHLNVENLNHLS